MLMVGLRGVGKTVLLDHMRDEAKGSRIRTMQIDAPESRSLPAILEPQLRVLLLELCKTERAAEIAKRALRGYAN